MKAIKTCLSDAFGYFTDAMDALDEIGKGSVGTGMTPLIGGYAMKDSKDNYRTALIKLDSARKALKPLAKRIADERVNDSHFSSGDAIVLIKDVTEFDYDILIDLLSERKGRESVWYRLRELKDKIEKAFRLVEKV